MLLKLITIILSLFFITGGGYFVYQKNVQFSENIKKLEKQKDTLKQILNELKGEKEESEEDEYAGWQTYTNTDIGYTLKYPSGWTLEEINKQSEVVNGTVKYIVIHTPDKLYFLDFGIKGLNDDFYTTERTGVGAGDFVPGKKLTILGTTIDSYKLVFEGKTKEIFYPKDIAKTPDGKFIFRANFSYGSEENYEKVAMDNLSYVNDAEKILTSIKLLSK